jgi:hypothetical protein
MVANRDEERPLLGHEEAHVKPTARNYSTWKILTALSALVLLFGGGAAYLGARTSQHPTRDAARLSNGTHEFKRTVILISIDGFRQVVRCTIPVPILILTLARVTSTVV